MRKLSLLIAGCMLACISLKAQVIFYENFNGISGSTSGGAGTYAFPAGWLLRNVDNRTPAAQTAYVNNSWVRREDFKFNVNDSCAFSSSWYSPAGAANDWMWTPAIAIPAGSPSTLSWRAVAYDPDYRDGYEVRIMVAPNTPTGGTGAIGNQITNSTVLYSNTAEESAWTTRSVSLGSYAGQTVYIGFRNNSNDKFILCIDDIKVERLLNYDAQVTAAAVSEYAQIPIGQAANLSFSGSIANGGAQPLTNVRLGARIYNESNTLVQEIASSGMSSLAAGATSNFTLPGWTPSAAGSYTIRYFPMMNETEQMPSNDTMVRTLVISDTTYARDRGAADGSLGIGAGNGGYLGQTFTLQQASYLSSISIDFTRGYTGRRYAAVVWDMLAGVPNSIIATTDTLLYADNNGFLGTLNIYGGPRPLAPGSYAVTAVEFDSTLAVTLRSEVYTPGTTWVNWPTNSFGRWANNEEFGASFAKPYAIRANVRLTQFPLPVRLLSFAGRTTARGNQLDWAVTEQLNIQRYTVERSSNGTSFSAIGSVTANSFADYRYDFTDVNPQAGINYYRLAIVENGQTTYSNTIRLDGRGQQRITLAPTPASDKVILQSSDLQLLGTNARLINLSGQPVKNVRITQMPYTLDIRDIPAGYYVLVLEDNTSLKVIKQ
ncbi:T9SS type A sorting domain-containing protein [Nostoc ellipsosporum NOK]|nr:T9SS type A sorting domain-containing protein [Nostoc ellipsosporum NOK]